MKLPEEMERNYNHTLFGEGTIQGLAEAIVRDCAKVCDGLYHTKEITCAWDEGEATGYQEAGIAILVRYGLTVSPTEQLVAERVGLLKP